MSIIDKLITKYGNKFNIKRERNVEVNKHSYHEIFNEYKYKHYHYTDKYNEKKYVFVNNEQKINDFNNPKIIMSFKSSPYKLNAWFDTGKSGTTDASMFFLTDNQKYIKFFNSKLIEFILKITQYSSPPRTQNEYKILNLITIPEGLKDNPTDQDIYDYYKITKDEKNLIEEIVKETPKLSKRTKKKLMNTSISSKPSEDGNPLKSSPNPAVNIPYNKPPEYDSANNNNSHLSSSSASKPLSSKQSSTPKPSSASKQSSSPKPSSASKQSSSPKPSSASKQSSSPPKLPKKSKIFKVVKSKKLNTQNSIKELQNNKKLSPKTQYDGPHEGKYLAKTTSKFKSKKYNSLNNAKRNANTNNTLGGITKSKKRYAVNYKFNLNTGTKKINTHKRKDDSDTIQEGLCKLPFIEKEGRTIKTYYDCYKSKYHKEDGIEVCATKHTKSGIRRKNFGFCIPEEYTDNPEDFKKLLDDIKSGKKKYTPPPAKVKTKTPPPKTSS